MMNFYKSPSYSLWTEITI